MSGTDEFERIAIDVRQVLTNQPSNPNALELYGLYKQATVGDVDIARPSLFDFRGKAKWDVWHSKKGLSKEEAKAQYITLGKTVLSEIMSQSLDLFSMAQTVKSVLPQVPIDVIRKDLIITNNVDESITRLLDGTVYYDLETEVCPPVEIETAVEEVKIEEVKVIEEETKIEDTNAKSLDTTATSETSSSPSKTVTIESEETETTLKTLSPMSFSTKAETFEKDPQQRMKSYQERKEKLLEVARAHYIEKHGLDK